MRLKEEKPKTIQELGEKAENYVEANASDIVFGIDPRSSNTRSLKPDTRQCHNCGEHVRSQCPEPWSPRNVKETSSAFMPPQTLPRQQRQN